MRALADTDRALELNVGGPIRPWIAQWWAHTPIGLASNFYEAMAMAEHFGFKPGRQPEDFWRCRSTSDSHGRLDGWILSPAARSSTNVATVLP